MTKKTGAEFRSELVWRSSFEKIGRWGLPVVHRQEFIGTNIDLIAYSDIKAKDTSANTEKGVHFFVDDPRFEVAWSQPQRTFEKLSQYRFLLTPDYSVYADMSPWMQLESIGRSRWCGAYWQSNGAIVYPTVTWGTPPTYEFSFSSIERNSTVAISTVGCRKSKRLFLMGYWAMLRAIQPEHIICFGEPFPEMKEVDVVIDYMESRKTVR